jgi:hypothetical protein
MGAVSRPCVKPPTGTGSAFSLADLSVPCDLYSVAVFALVIALISSPART